MTNCPHVYKRFADVRCDGSHDHQVCWDSEGGEAVQICAVLPAPLLRLPCTVLCEILQERALLKWGKDACRVIWQGSVITGFYVRLQFVTGPLDADLAGHRSIRA